MRNSPHRINNSHDKEVFTETQTAYRLAFVVTCISLTGIIVLISLTGPSAQYMFPWDFSFSVDGAWRLFNGQKIYEDFNSAVGPVPLLPAVLWMKISGPDADCLAMGYALMLPLFAIWTWIIASARLTALNAFLFTLFISLGLVSKFPVNMIDDYHALSFAMVYNRFGWALICLFSLQIFLPARNRLRDWKGIAAGISSGLLVSLLLFTKVNFFGIGILSYILAMILHPAIRRQFPAMIVSFVILSGLLVLLLDLDLKGFYTSVTELSKMHGLKELVGMVFERIGSSYHLAAILFLIVLLNLDLFLHPESSEGRTSWIKATFAACAVLAFQLAISAANAEFKATAYLALPAFMLYEGYRREAAFKPVSIQLAKWLKVRTLICFLLAALLAAKVMLLDTQTLVFAYTQRFEHDTQKQENAFVNSPSLSRMPYQAAPSMKAREEMSQTGYRVLSHHHYAYWINDGLRLLLNRIDKESRIMSFSFSNIFPFALQTQSPRGCPLWWHPGRVVSLENSPAPAELFADVTHLMIPKKSFLNMETAFFKQVYGETVKNRFSLVAESDLWELYLKH